ncbi:alpha/beta hydrolase [Paenibacillus swuensis]|uniref:Alpha/beta hydrolase n=1 Tax=Paenibacillus swuensis TaxID=1178515 RepID=A0A172TE23_9BACL|nr:alpha/beta hydrolase [Paenibacillus swuensis]ANE45147.1 alpha/beta hydrolase [Paenibacillus swuensis]
MAQHKIKLSNGLEMSYLDEGSATAEQAPVVLLHGYCGSSAYWEKFIPMISEDYRVIAPDLRGHGNSSAPQGAYSMEIMAEDIRLLLEELELNKVHLLGHSLGGYITLAFAETHSDSLKSFGLIHSTGYPDTPEGKAGRGKAISTIREQGLEVFMDGLAPKLFAPSHRQSGLDAVDTVKNIGLGTEPHAAAAAAEGMRDRPDRTAVIADTNLRVLLVAGGEDGVIPPEKTFSSTGNHITQARLESAGHMSMLETPRQLAAVVKEFLRTV